MFLSVRVIEKQVRYVLTYWFGGGLLCCPTPEVNFGLCMAAGS